jgi:serine/threonine protein kinase
MSLQRVRARVGKYELGRTLGEGNYAKVKFAKNVDTGQNVAIKILLEISSSNTRWWSRYNLLPFHR